MRYFDYRMSKALAEERLTQVRWQRRRPRDRADHSGASFRVKHRFGRWLMVFGERISGSKGDAD